MTPRREQTTLLAPRATPLTPQSWISTSTDWTTYPYKTSPRKHQAQGLTRAGDLPAFAWLWEAGTGKTWVGLVNAAHLWASGKLDRVLVLAPNGLQTVWLQQLEVHMPEWCRVTAIEYRSKWTPRQKRVAEETLTAAVARGDLLVVAMNVEALSNERAEAAQWAERFLRGGTQSGLWVDESQTIKTPSSARTKVVQRLSQWTAFRRILSGTAVTQGYHDLYSQYAFLDWRIIGVRTFTAFKAEYCTMGGFERRQIVAYRHIEDLLQKLAPVTMVVSRADCLDLPPRIMNTLSVDLSPEQREAYDRLKDEYSVAVSMEDTYDVELAIVRLGKLQQIVTGFLKTPEVVLEFPCPRVDLTVRLVQEARDKVIIWCAFQQNVRRLLVALEEAGVKALPFYGGISDDACRANAAAWQSSPDIQVLIAAPSKGARGFTWNEATTMIYYSQSFRYEHREQSLARNYRDGQTQSVLVHDIVTPRTTDVRVLKALTNKEDIANVVKTAAAFRSWVDG